MCALVVPGHGIELTITITKKQINKIWVNPGDIPVGQCLVSDMQPYNLLACW